MSVFVSRSFNTPSLDSKMIYLSRKNFCDETMNKVNWVTKMFCEWHQYRHNSGLQFFQCEIELKQSYRSLFCLLRVGFQPK